MEIGQKKPQIRSWIRWLAGAMATLLFCIAIGMVAFPGIAANGQPDHSLIENTVFTGVLFASIASGICPF
ncbi:MAG: hypothetical protein WCK15_20555 [Pirellula sp.]